MKTAYPELVGSATQGTTSTTLVVTLTKGCAAGDTLVVMSACFEGTIGISASVTADSGNNTWQGGGGSNSPDNTSIGIGIRYSNIQFPLNAGDTITLTCITSTNGMAAAVFKIPGSTETERALTNGTGTTSAVTSTGGAVSDSTFPSNEFVFLFNCLAANGGAGADMTNTPTSPAVTLIDLPFTTAASTKVIASAAAVWTNDPNTIRGAGYAPASTLSRSAQWGSIAYLFAVPLVDPPNISIF